MPGQNGRWSRRPAEPVSARLVDLHQLHLAQSCTRRTVTALKYLHFDSSDPTVCIYKLLPARTTTGQRSRPLLRPGSYVEETGFSQNPMPIHHLVTRGLVLRGSVVSQP